MSENVFDMHPSQWDPEHVYQWIMTMGKNLQKFAEDFKENKLNGEDLYDLEKAEFMDQFKEMKNAFGKKKLWKAITGLRQDHPKAKKDTSVAMDMGDSDEGGDDEDFPELDIPSKAPPLGGSFPPPPSHSQPQMVPLVGNQPMGLIHPPFYQVPENQPSMNQINMWKKQFSASKTSTGMPPPPSAQITRRAQPPPPVNAKLNKNPDFGGAKKLPIQIDLKKKEKKKKKKKAPQPPPKPKKSAEALRLDKMILERESKATYFFVVEAEDELSCSQAETKSRQQKITKYFKDLYEQEDIDIHFSSCCRGQIWLPKLIAEGNVLKEHKILNRKCVITKELEKFDVFEKRLKEKLQGMPKLELNELKKQRESGDQIILTLSLDAAIAKQFGDRAKQTMGHYCGFKPAKGNPKWKFMMWGKAFKVEHVLGMVWDKVERIEKGERSPDPPPKPSKPKKAKSPRKTRERDRPKRVRRSRERERSRRARSRSLHGRSPRRKDPRRVPPPKRREPSPKRNRREPIPPRRARSRSPRRPPPEERHRDRDRPYDRRGPPENRRPPPNDRRSPYIERLPPPDRERRYYEEEPPRRGRYGSPPRDIYLDDGYGRGGIEDERRRYEMERRAYDDPVYSDHGRPPSRRDDPPPEFMQNPNNGEHCKFLHPRSSRMSGPYEERRPIREPIRRMSRSPERSRRPAFGGPPSKWGKKSESAPKRRRLNPGATVLQAINFEGQRDLSYWNTNRDKIKLETFNVGIRGNSDHTSKPPRFGISIYGTETQLEDAKNHLAQSIFFYEGVMEIFMPNGLELMINKREMEQITSNQYMASIFQRHNITYEISTLVSDRGLRKMWVFGEHEVAIEELSSLLRKDLHRISTDFILTSDSQKFVLAVFGQNGATHKALQSDTRTTITVLSPKFAVERHVRIRGALGDVMVARQRIFDLIYEFENSRA